MNAIQQWPQAFCGDQIQTFCVKANQSIDEDGKNVYFLLQKVAFQVDYTLVLTEAELVCGCNIDLRAIAD